MFGQTAKISRSSILVQTVHLFIFASCVCVGGGGVFETQWNVMIINLKKRKKERKNMEKEEEKYNTSTLTKGNMNAIFIFLRNYCNNAMISLRHWHQTIFSGEFIGVKQKVRNIWPKNNINFNRKPIIHGVLFCFMDIRESNIFFLYKLVGQEFVLNQHSIGNGNIIKKFFIHFVWIMSNIFIGEQLMEILVNLVPWQYQTDCYFMTIHTWA